MTNKAREPTSIVLLFLTEEFVLFYFFCLWNEELIHRLLYPTTNTQKYTYTNYSETLSHPSQTSKSLASLQSETMQTAVLVTACPRARSPWLTVK